MLFAEPALWESLSFSVTGLSLADGEARHALLTRSRWLLRRCGGMARELQIVGPPTNACGVLQDTLLEILRESPASLPALTVRQAGSYLRLRPPAFPAAVLHALPQRFPALQRLKIEWWALPLCAPAALAQLRLASLSLELVKAPPRGFEASLAALSGTLTALHLHCREAFKAPAPAGLPLLENCELVALAAQGFAFQVGGNACCPSPVCVGGPTANPPLHSDPCRCLQDPDATCTRAALSAAPLRALTLQCGPDAALPQLLAHMLPRAARPLQRLVLVNQAMPAAELAACASDLSGLLQLSLQQCPGVPAALEQLLPLALSLTALEIKGCTCSQLPPAVLALTGLRSLVLENQDIRFLPAGLPPAPVMAGKGSFGLLAGVPTLAFTWLFRSARQCRP